MSLLSTSIIPATLLSLFHAFCLQAHTTTFLTPSFAHQVQSSIPDFNTGVFPFTVMALSDNGLNNLFIGINALIVAGVTGLAGTKPQWRKAGFVLTAAFLGIGFWSDVVLETSVVPHVVLLGLAGWGWWAERRKGLGKKDV